MRNFDVAKLATAPVSHRRNIEAATAPRVSHRRGFDVATALVSTARNLDVATAFVSHTRKIEAATALVFVFVCALAACGAGDRECAADDDCAIDAVCRAGVCAAIESGEGEGAHGEGEGAQGEGEGEGSVGEGEGAAGEGEGAAGEGEGAAHCSLDDGALSADDLPVVPGLPLRFVEADSSFGDVSVDVDGNNNAWDFTSSVDGDAPFAIEASLLSDQWFASDFNEAPLGTDGVGAYVAPLSSDTVAIFRRNSEQLVILGVASVDANFTLIKYNPPILVLQFPLALGDTFASTSAGNGTFETNPFYASTDIYQSSIDARGSVVTNAGTFAALRLRIDQSVTVGVFTVTHIQYAWVAPCLGVVAQVTSADDETDPHFTSASQLRRLAAP